MNLPILKLTTRADYLKALDAVVTEQRASKNFLQKKCSMGFQKACEIMSAFEVAGYVSSAGDNGRHTVLATWADLDELTAAFAKQDADDAALQEAKEEAWRQADQGELIAQYKRPPAFKSHMKFSEDAACEIFDRVSAGEPLSTILDSPHLPSFGTWTGWLEGLPQFDVPNSDSLKTRYYLARLARADLLSSMVLEIADDDSADVREISLPGSVKVKSIDKEAIQRSKLRVDTRRWILERAHPEFFAAEQDPNRDRDQLLKTNTQSLDMASLTAEAREKLIAFLVQVEADKTAGLLPA